MSTLGCWFTPARRTQSRSLTWTETYTLTPRAGAMPVLRCDVGLTLTLSVWQVCAVRRRRLIEALTLEYVVGSKRSAWRRVECSAAFVALQSAR